MELDDKHIKVLEAIFNFNKCNHILACKKDVEKTTKLSYNTVSLRLKDLENCEIVTIEKNRRITEIQLTEKGRDIILGAQKSIDEYTKNY